MDPSPDIEGQLTLSIARRFCGPPESGNGGYTSGRLVRLAGQASAPTTVTLRRPPPLETPLTVDGDADFAILRAAGLVIADAKPGKLLHDPVPTLDVERAMSARAAYPGLNDHPFDHCFVCGPLRAYGDGMKLCPGPVGDGMTACVWTPDESLADPSDPALVGYEFVWSAMDCPGGWTSDLTARPLVLGRMTALVERVPAIGRPVVVVGKLLDTDGRKSFTAVTAYEPDGEIIGHAEQVWIEVDPALFYSA